MKRNALFNLLVLALFGVSYFFVPKISVGQHQGDLHISEITSSDDFQNEEFLLPESVMDLFYSESAFSSSHVEVTTQKQYEKQLSYYYFSFKKNPLSTNVFQNSLFYPDASGCKNHIKLQRFNI